MSDVFNPEAFMNTEVDSENSTRMLPTPEGDYLAAVEEVKADTVGNDSKPVLRVKWGLQDNDGSIEAATGRKNVAIEQLIFLDLTGSGGLDMGEGKNVQLGRIRKALGQNKAGQPWAPSMMNGQVATVTVGHRADKNDPEVVYDSIKRVTEAQ